jgi:D-alanyl-D-alanine carboxypeptidase
MATFTLAGSIATVYTRDQYYQQVASQQATLKDLKSTITKLQLEKARESTLTSAKKISNTIIKKQKEEVAKQKALAAAKRANVPTVSINDNCSKSHAHDNPARVDVIVNKRHCIQPLNFTPSVVSVSCAGNGVAVIAAVAVGDFKQLCQAAENAGVPLGITSSYRSYETQITTYNYWVAARRSDAAADRYSARPGYSEHQTGLSVDFSVAGGSGLDGFTGTAQQKWMAKHAYKYGWVQRYTSANSGVTGYNAESWHYRYIGRAAAAQYVSSGASSLESFWNTPGGAY